MNPHELMTAHPPVSAVRKSPCHRSHGAHPYSKDSTTNNSSTSVALYGNIKTENRFGEVASLSITQDNGRESQKLSKNSSLNRKMFHQSADLPLSTRELNRIKRYHTVDIDTNFRANFNYDFSNDNGI